MLRREKPGAARENNMEGWVLLSRVVREDFPKEMTFRMRSQRWEDGHMKNAWKGALGSGNKLMQRRP